jgi:Right handed beta helix region
VVHSSVSPPRAARPRLIAGLLLGVATVSVAQAKTLDVGPGQTLRTPSAAARVATSGDTIAIRAGIYEDDSVEWTQDNLTIRGVGGTAHLRSPGTLANGKGIWVIRGRNTTVENLEFSGAHVPDHNGAGIRGEGVGLIIRNCYFHHNENGLLAGGGPDSEILIEHSEFAANGYGDGYSHNMYIVAIKRFTLRGSYVHHARVGHNVKSRAVETHILYNRIMDEVDGDSSYAVDLPNGGVAYVIGNLIQKGPRARNPRLLAYGAEGLRPPRNELYVIHNTMVSDRAWGGTFLRVWGAPTRLKIVNNLFVGPGVVVNGRRDGSQNLVTDRPGFMNRAAFDYRLRPDSPAIGAGIDPGTVNGVGLRPRAEYVHKAREQPRRPHGRLDVGASEYRSD